MKCNNFIKGQIKSSGFHQWEIAEAIGVTEFTFSKWLRREFDAEKIELVLSAIQNLKNGGAMNG